MNPDPRELVAAAADDELPALAGQLEEARALLWLRLQGLRPRRLLTIDEAAERLAVSVRRARSWSRCAPWAVRLGPRALRVDESKLMDWMSATGHNPALKAAAAGRKGR